jgi:hypothetical protein
LASQVDRYPFTAFGQSQGHKVVDFKNCFLFQPLTPSVKPLGLISVIAPIGMRDLSSTLDLTPSLKWA